MLEPGTGWTVAKPCSMCLKRLHAAISGLHSLPKDCYALFGRCGDGPWRSLPQPWYAYRADPFLICWQGETWLLFEEFEYLRNKGRLAACRLDGSDYGVVMDRDYHLSYPFPLWFRGRLYLVPESCANRSVDLYECVTFPGQWRKVRTLLSGLDAVDATLLWESERWWLFTSVRPDEGQRHLRIYSSDDLLAGEWEPHPINDQCLYAGLRNQTGRSGGAFFQHEGQWIRPCQCSQDYYGQGLAFRALRTLTRHSFSEEGVDLPLPWNTNHHLTMLDDHQWINRKIRVSYTSSPRPLPDNRF